MLSPGEIEDPQITSEQLLSLKSDMKIINMLEELSNKHCPFQFKDIESGGKIPKSNEKATTLREAGHKFFKQRKFLKALLSFTESIANAEDNCEILALSYASRSEVLFQQGYYKECLEDITRALQNNYPKNAEAKLLETKAQAELKLPQQILKTYHETSPSLLHLNPKIPCASDSIEIQRDDYGGRQIVAVKNIEAGEIIAVEKPYLVAVGIGPSQKYLHCHECLELCYNLIPCSHCRTALYCSEKCREIAKQSYHYNECDLCQFDFVEQLNIKIVLKGLKEITSIGNNGQPFDGTIFKSDRYEEIQELQTNKEKRSVRDLFEAANEACIYYYFLKKYSDFFTQIDIGEERFKELLFHHYFSTSCNKMSVQKIKKTSVDTEFHEVGEAIYAFSSLFNHHCYGNVTPSFYGSSIVLRAANDIKAGENCCLTYKNYNFAEYPKLVRAHQLWRYYHFNCKCEACENNWPIFDCLNTGNIDNYQKLVELVKKSLNESTDTSKLLKDVIKQVKELPTSEPTKVELNIKRIFCDLLKISGNKIIDF